MWRNQQCRGSVTELPVMAAPIRNASDYFPDIATPHVTRDMVKLAEHILATKAGKFDPSNRARPLFPPNRTRP